MQQSDFGNPKKILALILLVNAVLFGIWLAFPEKGIAIGKDVVVKVPNPKEYFKRKEKTEQSVVVEKIKSTYKNNTYSEDSVNHSDIPQEEIMVSATEKIIQPNDLENAMELFYKKLESIEDGKLVRVLHFGDSQIEGDRISGVLRDLLQNKFGGCGVGYIPLSDPGYGRKNVQRTASKNWTKYSVVRSENTPPHNDYGFLGSYYHWVNDNKNTGATINIKANKASNSKLQKFEQISLMYHHQGDPVLCKLSSDTNIIHNSNLPLDSGTFQQTWNYNGFQNKEIQFSFSGNNLTDIYGVSLDCKSGIAVDNISLRGSSGTDFTKMNKQTLKAQISQLNVGLIIYQFGVNVVPNEVNNYDFYMRMIVSQINYLKQMAPNASILIVGVSDMCKKEETEFVSYGNIEKIRDAQKEAARLTGCAFWDLYEVMGGKNSMAQWVEANPSLAEKDYTHFNWRGANVVGDKLGNAILKDYYDYKELEIQ